MIDFLLFGLLIGIALLQKDYADFVKEHNKKPYCISKEIGAETVKKCYIATEVK